MVIAGEASGDLHGASFIKELKKLDPAISVCGIGGDQMKAEGMETVFHINQMAFLGFVEVLKHIPFIKEVQKKLIGVIEERKIKTIVLIDYPGFNLNFAKKLRRMDIKVVYYISPQLWAWGAGRVKKIRKYVDRMIVLFPFESEFYKKHDINAECVGHPLIKQLNDYKFQDKEKFCKEHGLQLDKDILCILPGSRMQEINTILPETLQAAEKIAAEFNMQIAVACSTNIDENVFDKYKTLGKFAVIKNKTYELFRYSKLGIVKSGTSTLEAGLFGLPMVVVYKTNFLTYLIGKSLIKIDKIGLVNIVAGEKIVPELIQNDASSEKIYAEAANILRKPELYNGIKDKLKIISSKLGEKDASAETARIVFSYLT